MKNKIFTLALTVFWVINTLSFSAQNTIFTGPEQGVFAESETIHSPLNHLPYYYNHAEVICGLDQLAGFSFNQVPPVMSHFWPGCEQCCAFHAPQWIVFSVGETPNNRFSLNLEVTDCNANMGVQIAIYEIPCDTDFDPTESTPGILPTAEMLFTGCALVTSPQIGVVNVSANNVVAGAIYGMVIDGWAQDRCRIEIIEILEGGESPVLGSDPDVPVYQNHGWGEDTLCILPQGTVFRIENEVEGACSYLWTLEDTETAEKIVLQSNQAGTSARVNFQESGKYRICVVASNACETSNPACREVTVIESDDILEHPESLSVQETENGRFDVVASVPGAAYQWQADFGQGFENISPSQTFFGVNSSRLIIRNVSRNLDGLRLRCLVIVGNCSSISDVAILTVRPIYASDARHCDDNPTRLAEILNPETGRIWMDRNMGAQRRAFIPRDARSYGDLYQWGRFSDGHQCRNSADTMELSPFNRPGHDRFIISNNFPQDWRTQRTDDLWDGMNAENNPCPDGFRIPTIFEWREEMSSWSSGGGSSASPTSINLPLAGIRQTDGNIRFEGVWGYYWSSTVNGDRAFAMSTTGTFFLPRSSARANGYSVRCIKEDPSVTDDIFKKSLKDPESFVIKSDRNTSGELELNVFPNPTKDYLNVELKGPQTDDYFHLQIFNPFGQIMISENYWKGNILIDVSQLLPGVYLLRVYNSEQSIFRIANVIVH